MKFSVYLPPQSRSRSQGAGAVLPVRADLHRGDLPDQGSRAADRCRAWDSCWSRRTPVRANRACPGDADSWDFGQGAGFYVDATEPPWSTNYRMYSYVTRELPRAGGRESAGDCEGAPGSSAIRWAVMARWCARCAIRRNTDPCRRSRRSRRRCNVPGDKKAFGNYLGTDSRTLARVRRQRIGGAQAVSRADPDRSGHRGSISGRAVAAREVFAAAAASGQPLNLRMQPGYDHGYYFIQTFMADHLRHHAAFLKAE